MGQEEAQKELLYAGSNGLVEVTRFLLQAGAAKDATDGLRTTALMSLCGALLGFLVRQLKIKFYSYPGKCSQGPHVEEVTLR